MQAHKDNASPAGATCTFTPRAATSQHALRVPPWLPFDTLNQLVGALDVQVIALSECVVGPGFELDLNACDTPSFHYLRKGHGRLYTPNEMPVEIGPQTLVIVPPKCRFRFELAAGSRSTADANESPPGSQSPTAAFLLCGVFRTLYGGATDLFDTLHVPIIEQFADDDALERKLRMALTELVAHDVCSDVLVSAAMRQVIVAFIRRSFLSLNGWTRRFAVLNDLHHASATKRETPLPG